MKKPAKKVRRGIKWLDLMFGSRMAWRKKVNLRELDMVRREFCILGQISGNYNKVNEIGSDNTLAEFGFCVSEGYAISDISANEELTRAWKKALRRK